MKTTNNILLGLFLIAIGIYVLLHELNYVSFDLFFDGWWSLLIIIPSTISLITKPNKIMSLMCIAIGVLFLLGFQGILEKRLAMKLIFPTIIIFVGLHFMLKPCKNKCHIFENDNHTDNFDGFQNINYEGQRDYAVLFSGQKVDVSNQLFKGANIKIMFGGFNLDLRRAVFDSDTSINIQCLLGGAEIYVPNNINIEIVSNSICGGIDMNGVNNPGSGHKTLYIDSNCIFGGIDIKH